MTTNDPKARYTVQKPFGKYKAGDVVTGADLGDQLESRTSGGFVAAEGAKASPAQKGDKGDQGEPPPPPTDRGAQGAAPIDKKDAGGEDIGEGKTRDDKGNITASVEPPRTTKRDDDQGRKS